MPAVTGETQPIMRMVEVLPAPLGPRKPKASPGCDVEVDAVDGGEVAEALGQPAGMDERGDGVVDTSAMVPRGHRGRPRPIATGRLRYAWPVTTRVGCVVAGTSGPALAGAWR